MIRLLSIGCFTDYNVIGGLREIAQWLENHCLNSAARFLAIKTGSGVGTVKLIRNRLSNQMVMLSIASLERMNCRFTRKKSVGSNLRISVSRDLPKG